MNLLTLETNLNNLLCPQDFHDFCPNGLIVDATGDNPEISMVVTGVSLREDLIDAAIERGANVILVHHANGFWNSDKNKCIDGSQHGRYVRKLIQSGISLFGYHLPLDAHEEYGNNISVFNALGLEKTKWEACNRPFDPRFNGINMRRNVADRFMYDNIGYGGPGVITKELLDKVFPKGYQSFNFESGKKYNVAVCTGSAASEFDEVIKHGYDMLVTGEIRESTPILAKEYGIAVIAAGHHRSEVFGVRNIANLIESMGVEAEFVDIDNPI
jgi:dinuclear metal center YbgI/SA1388 family protein